MAKYKITEAERAAAKEFAAKLFADYKEIRRADERGLEFSTTSMSALIRLEVDSDDSGTVLLAVGSRKTSIEGQWLDREDLFALSALLKRVGESLPP